MNKLTVKASRIFDLFFAASIAVVLYMAFTYFCLDPVRDIKRGMELRRDSVVQAKMPRPQ